MNRLLPLFLCSAAIAAPVPKEKPDPLPEGALVRLGSNRYRGPSTDGVVFSKDGKTLYAVTWNLVYRWSAESGKPLDPITLDIKWDMVQSARIWADRLFLLERPAQGGGLAPATCHVFDLPGGKEAASFEVKGLVYFTSFGYMQPPAGASEDGKRFAVADQQGTKLTVLDVDTGKTLAEFAPDPNLGATKRHLSPSGKLAAAVGFTATTVFDVDAKKDLYAMPGSFGFVECSPDEKTMAGYKVVIDPAKKAKERVLVAWDATTGKQQHTLPLDGEVWHMQFCGNDAVVVGHTTSDAYAHKGIALTRWNLKTGKADWTVPAAFQVGGFILSAGWIAVSPDATRFVVSNRESLMTVYDAATGKRVDDNPAHNEKVEWAEFSKDGKTVTTLTERDIRVWDAATGELKTATAPKELNRTNFAGVTNDLFVWYERSPDFKKTELIAWDRKANKLAWREDTEVPSVGRVHAVGERVVVYGSEPGAKAGVVRVFDQKGKKEADWSAPSLGFSTKAAATADAVLVSGADGKGPVRVLAWKTGEETAVIDTPAGNAFRGGVELIAPAGDRAVVRVGSGWVVADTKTGKVLHQGEVGGRGSEAAAASADGSKMMLTVAWPNAARMDITHSVKVLELKEKGKTWTFDGKGAAASTVAFSPDGTKAVVGYRDGTALIWDVSK